MGRFDAAAKAGDLAEARLVSNDLAVASRQLGIKMLGLSVCLAVMLAGTVLGGLMLGGYVRPPAMPSAEVQHAGLPVMGISGIAAAGSLYLLILHWMAKVKVGMDREALDIAIRETAGA